MHASLMMNGLACRFSATCCRTGAGIPAGPTGHPPLTGRSGDRGANPYSLGRRQP